MRYFNTLRHHRDARALRQWDIAIRTGITLDRYGRLEKGSTQPSYDEARRLAAFFDLAADELFPPQHAEAVA